jgi:uracil-DNA glycosylase family 4
METFEELRRRIIHCERCPRLIPYCREIARVRKREFREQSYWGKPVPGWGDPKARLWIVGLAPAAHGANRTGRMFTGDSSGNWLYHALHATGFANQAEAVSIDDGLMLSDVYISSSARCAPPDNKPLPSELAACEPFLDAEFRLLKHRTLILALGNIALQAVLRLLARQGIAAGRPKPAFGHGAFHAIGPERILCSYHPSRQNTQTGRLTRSEWLAIFEKARELL